MYNLQNTRTFKKGKSDMNSQKSKYPLGLLCPSIQLGFPVSCPKMRALQISLAIWFYLFTENSILESLFESLLHEPYEFPPLYFPLICPRMLQDTNIDFKFDLKLYHTAKVSALVYNSTFKPLGFAGKV